MNHLKTLIIHNILHETVLNGWVWGSSSGHKHAWTKKFSVLGKATRNTAKNPNDIRIPDTVKMYVIHLCWFIGLFWAYQWAAALLLKEVFVGPSSVFLHHIHSICAAHLILFNHFHLKTCSFVFKNLAFHTSIFLAIVSQTCLLALFDSVPSRPAGEWSP